MLVSLPLAGFTTRLSFRLIRPRGVLHRRIRTSKDPCIARPSPATKFAWAGIGGIIIYASFHRSPAQAHSTTSIAISHYSASPQRLTTSETQSERCLSQANSAAAASRAQRSDTTKKDVRPAPRLRRHRRGAHQQRGQAARPARESRPQSIDDSVPWRRDFIHTTRLHRTRSWVLSFPILSTHRSSSRTSGRFSRGSTWR